MTRILPNVPTSNLTSILVGGANQMILKGTDKYYRRSSFNLNAILPAYIAVLLICLTGNILVCVTIFRNKKMRKRHYYFLANLSIADIGFALATPGQLINFAQVDTGKQQI